MALELMVLGVDRQLRLEGAGVRDLRRRRLRLTDPLWRTVDRVSVAEREVADGLALRIDLEEDSLAREHLLAGGLGDLASIGGACVRGHCFRGRGTDAERGARAQRHTDNLPAFHADMM